jgi:iron(III) transport system substrate-binding protein
MLKSVLRASLAVAASFVAVAAAQADITVYSASPAGLIDSLSKGFTAKTGVKVNVYQATTGQIMARIESEAANPVVDVLISASWDTANDFAKRGWLVDYTSPNAANVPDFLKSPGAVAQGVSALAIAWNPKSNAPEPAEWSDLTKPEYKDLVNIPDPALSGSSFELTAALAGQDDFGLFKALKANGAIVAGANADALNATLQGAKAVTFGAVDYNVFAAAKKGESVKVIFPKGGTVIAPRPMMILNWSKQQDEAKQFVDYVLSDEGQAAVAKAQLMPARTDVKADRPLITDLTLLKYDTAAVYGKRADTLKTFADIFAAQ